MTRLRDLTYLFLVGALALSQLADALHNRPSQVSHRLFQFRVLLSLLCQILP